MEGVKGALQIANKKPRKIEFLSTLVGLLEAALKAGKSATSPGTSTRPSWP